MIDQLDLIVAVPPTTEPVSLTEAKAHCRVDGADEDSLIESLIATARNVVEEQIGRALITQTLELRIDAWPILLYLPRPPVISVDSITYTDDNGVTAILDPDAYMLRTGVEPAYIRFNSARLPTVNLADDAAITVRYIAGYGVAAQKVPRSIRHAILLLVGHYYANREAVAPGAQTVLPYAVETLLAPYKVYWYTEWAQ
ncbi:MAG: phage head-tail connector protein [Roseiflexus sp.]|jgi:uncharacterized phiE125 gp8 family phage protein|nr:phage head-tail connector protein [Roseiflexus sp.]